MVQTEYWSVYPTFLAGPFLVVSGPISKKWTGSVRITSLIFLVLRWAGVTQDAIGPTRRRAYTALPFPQKKGTSVRFKPFMNHACAVTFVISRNTWFWVSFLSPLPPNGFKVKFLGFLWWPWNLTPTLCVRSRVCQLHICVAVEWMAKPLIVSKPRQSACLCANFHILCVL